MNWFERYGIGGIFFMALSFLYIEVYFPAVVVENSTVILGLVVTFFLPIGYIVSTIAQWFAYHNPFESSQIHLRALKFAEGKVPHALEGADLKAMNEFDAESWITMRYTEYAGDRMARERRIMMVWASGKNDVLTMNLALMCSSLFFLFETILTMILYSNLQHGFNIKLSIITTAAVSIIYGFLYAGRHFIARQLYKGYIDFLPRYLGEVLRYRTAPAKSGEAPSRRRGKKT